MTPTRLAECLQSIGWTQAEFARRMKRDDRVARRMLSGDARLRKELGEWLERVAAAIIACGPCPDDRGRG